MSDPKISEFSMRISRLEGERAYIVSQRTEKVSLLSVLQRKEKNSEEAAEIILAVSQITQEQVKERISDLVSGALRAVFSQPYTFIMDFVQRRNKTEVDFLFERNGKAIDPMYASGGGAIDVASFALRVALWAMKRPRPSNTIVLDEPFRFLSKELQPKAAVMLKELSSKLGIQFIMVTHNKDLIEVADKVFSVSQSSDGVSSVESK